MKHYIAMAGLRGCLPNWCDVFKNKEDAIESAVWIHEDAELGRPRIKSQLRQFGFAELDLHKWGNEYVEVTQCDCSEPWIHQEDFAEDQFKQEWGLT